MRHLKMTDISQGCKMWDHIYLFIIEFINQHYDKTIQISFIACFILLVNVIAPLGSTLPIFLNTAQISLPRLPRSHLCRGEGGEAGRQEKPTENSRGKWTLLICEEGPDDRTRMDRVRGRRFASGTASVPEDGTITEAPLNVGVFRDKWRSITVKWTNRRIGRHAWMPVGVICHNSARQRYCWLSECYL